MFHSIPVIGLGLFGALLCAAALAQQHPPPPAAAASLSAYRSALEGYRPFADQSVAPWKDSNQAVQDAGGWRAYAREARDGSASAPARAAAAAAAPAASAPAAPGAGHKH